MASGSRSTPVVITRSSGRGPCTCQTETVWTFGPGGRARKGQALVWSMEEEEAALPGPSEPPPSSAEEEGKADVSEGRLRVASYVEADAERLACS